MQFAVAALKAGQKAAVYMFDEVLDTLIDRSRSCASGKAGGIRAVHGGRAAPRPAGGPGRDVPGAFAHEVRRAVEAGAKVVVIDSLNGYLNAMPEERFLTTHLHELFAYLNQKGVVTIMVVAQHGHDRRRRAGRRRRRELPGRHGAAVPLLRGAGRDPPGRQRVQEADRAHTSGRSARCRITATGVTVGEPLREFRGVMTGRAGVRGGRPDAGPADAEGEGLTR